MPAELTSVGKPARHPYRYAAERLGFAISDCLVIEDSVAGPAGADRLVDDLSDEVRE
ncbi:MAG: hypothetical protein ACJ74U_10225 [Jatrophihabitantaceae bacterium]